MLANFLVSIFLQVVVAFVMTAAIVAEAPSLAFLRYEQARRELSLKRTDALRRKKHELELQKKQADALENRRTQRIAAVEKAWERRQLVVRVSYMVTFCDWGPPLALIILSAGFPSGKYCSWIRTRMGFGRSASDASRGKAPI
jgi:hypothetical protein